MDQLSTTKGIIYIVSDITAGVFLSVLIISIMLQSEKKRGISHLLASEIIMLAGIFMRLLAAMVGQLSDGFADGSVLSILMPRSTNVIWVMGFILITIGLSEAAVHTIYIKEEITGTVISPVMMINCFVAVAGCILFLFTGEIDVLVGTNLMQMICLLIYLRRKRSIEAYHLFGRASLVAIIAFSLSLFESIRLTGLGLSLMLMMLNEQYHSSIGQQLAENEAALANSKLQLLAEQISPHYIYNSLQSIRGLVGTDPEKAGMAIDAFSDYLRGNLESLTKEELIPFERELEHTRVYLELEKIAGQREFQVEYDLETTDFMLPPLVLQPLVENAVQHGAAWGSGNNMITIATHVIEEGISLEVTDQQKNDKDNAGTKTDSQRLSEEALLEPDKEVSPKTATNRKKRKSVGLQNVRTRLNIQCGGKLDIRSNDNGTIATIILPGPPKNATSPEHEYH